MKREPFQKGTTVFILTAEYFIKGLIVGFVVAAPVGPVAVMCIHRTIAHGRIAGYICGLGATAADTIFGALAALGLGFIAADLMAHHQWLRLVGGGVLVLLGLRMAFARHLPRSVEKQEEAEEREELEERIHPKPRPALDYHIGNFAAAFAIMITNPITLISFAAIFASIDITNVRDYARWGVSLVTGVALGAAIWWTLLVVGTSLISHRVTEAGILWVSRISGAMILAFGIILLVYPSAFGRAAPQAGGIPAVVESRAPPGRLGIL